LHSQEILLVQSRDIAFTPILKHISNQQNMSNTSSQSSATSLVIGLSIPQTEPDVSKALQMSREDGYDFVTTHLPFAPTPIRSDVTALTGRWWRTSVVGTVTPATSSNEFVSKLEYQIEWAMHMGIPAVILPPPPPEALMEFARVLQSLAIKAQASNLQLWIRTGASDKAMSDYDLLQRFCGSLPNIGMLLEMSPTPTLSSAEATVALQLVLLHKAVALQLKAISFPANVFLTNKKGYPVLAKSHQIIFAELLKRIGRTVRVMVEGPSAHADIDNAGVTKCLPYLQYIQHLRSRENIQKILDSEEATLETPYLDSLQRPLQPLKDHLEFSMYETFEKDPVKYAKYQEAVYMALSSGIASMNLSSDSPKMIIIAVAGAGRGPLVMKCIQAFERLQTPPGSLILKVFAVEKNPSAIVYLESMAALHPMWKGIVTVVRADARGIQLSQLDGNKVDIVVSELLGSFGDNELSPECLEPLLHSDCCKTTTISIPMSYQSYLAPVSSVRLYNDAAQQAQVPHDGAQPLGIQRAMETSYVVRPHLASQTHREQQCWSFEHPAKEEDFKRSAALEFAPDPTFGVACGCGYGPVDAQTSEVVAQAPTPSVGPISVHGLLGTFTAVLFTGGGQHCEISTAPHRFSTGMFSWFPLYFPFKEPLRVPADANLSVKMWRRGTGSRVWYEWSAMVHRKGEILALLPIHNPDGRSSDASLLI
jgi:type II protein arginine methyltransferase